MARIEEWQMRQRCWDNGIRIYYKPIEKGYNSDVILVIQRKNRIDEGKIIYKQDYNGQIESSKRINELYLDLYFSYKNKFLKDKVWCFKKNDYISIK